MPSNSRSWLLVPTFAVAVRADIGEGGVLDALERAIVGLAKLRNRTQYDLARLLCMPEDVVASAVARLSALGVLEVSNGEVAIGEYADEDGATEPHTAWIVFDPYTRYPLKRLLLRRPPAVSQPARELPQFALSDEGGTTKLNDQTLQERLSLLSLEGELPMLNVDGEVLPASGQSDDSDVAGVRFQGSVDIGTVPVQSILLEKEPRRPVKFLNCFAWVQVEFLQQLVGPALPVFHDPDVLGDIEGLEPQPINQLWSDRCSPELDTWLEEEARRYERQDSVVLKLVGIESVEQLDAAVDEHYAAMKSKFESKADVASDDERTVLRSLRSAISWLVISQREETRYYAEAWRSYAYAIENLSKRLGDTGDPFVESWVRAYREGPNEHKEREANRIEQSGYVDRRLRGFGLKQALELGDTAGHLRRNAKSLKKLMGNWGQRSRFGAGANVSVWLLPLILLDDQAATRYAEPLKLLVQHQPQVFAVIANLIEVRNDAFHIGDRPAVPEELRSIGALDHALSSVWFAVLESGVLS